MVDDPPGIETNKLDGLYLRLLRELPRSLVEELPWMEPVEVNDLEKIYDRLMTCHLITPGLAYMPPGVLCTAMELEPDMGVFLWNMIEGGMPLEGLVWCTLMGRDMIVDVLHPDALPQYTHPEGRVHALMFPLVYLLQQYLVTEGTVEQMWRPRYKDGENELDDSQLNYYCSYVGVTSYRFVEFIDAFTSQMKKMLSVLNESVFVKLGLH
eukprot:4140864-Amphidinium_carterae.2